MSGASKVEARRWGFTMVEIMVATALFSIVVGSILSTFMVFANSSEGLAAYVDMSMDSRSSLESCARDIRSSENILYATETEIVLQYPDNSFYDGAYVKYVFDDISGFFTRFKYDQSAVVDTTTGAITGKLISENRLLEGVEKFVFNYYDPLGDPLDPNSASLLLSIKSIQIDAKMLRTISKTSASDYIISARFLMRNRNVTQ